jgi:hypothetical protein
MLKVGAGGLITSGLAAGGLEVHNTPRPIPVFVSRGRKKTRQFGANFSIPYAKWLSGKWGGPGVGPSWQESLRTILSLGVNPIRLSLQWNQIDEHGFEEIDAAVKMIGNYGSSAIICAGAKTPQWPEVHLPDRYRAKALSRGPGVGKHELNTFPGSDGIHDELLEFVGKIVTRYRNNKAVVAFQLENEPLEPFGDPKLSVSYAFLKEEVKLARSLTAKPLMVNFGAGLTGSLSQMKEQRYAILMQLLELDVDWIGLDLYQRGYIKVWGPIIVSFQADYEHWRIAHDFVRIIEQAGKRARIAELQMGPWEADRSKVNYANPEGNRSLRPAELSQIVSNTVELDSDGILLWELEFQVACAHAGNPAWINETRRIMNPS